MFLLKVSVIFIFLMFLPIVWGIALKSCFVAKTDRGIITYYVTGWLGILALFDLIAVPMVFLRVKFHLLVISWTSLVIVIPFILLFLNRNILKEAKITFSTPRFSWIFVIAILLILYQIFMITYFQHVDDDDAFYIGTAVTTWHTDTMYQYSPYSGVAYDAYPARYVLSPLPLFHATIARLSGLHPAVIARTILPFFLILLCYGSYYLVGEKLFKRNKNAISIFLILISLLNICGNTSEYTISSFLLFRIWQGKALLINALLPYSLYIMLNINRNTPFSEWIYILIANLAACLISSMGIFLFPVFIGIQALFLSISVKKPSILYKTCISCLPSIIFGCIYLFLR